ncbi:hypothetical protein HH310_21695 [Actinoplanes sp. TBRC 11911]|uniref:hypothetical protein n=1 Tax=Actinoplanes sp. TBRC 11911 TaxID=2729386 RepID=UPI00145F2C95|nr:hypothetical protein [Actinoplanes sp. TBRC 11911]NMO53784.1 hypothetical protein [Actinoplanes sp. TBRC 11911]
MDGTPPAFYRTDRSIALSSATGPWQEQAGKELGRAFDPSNGPLMRVVQTDDENGTTLVLTLEHCIADAMGAMYVLRDLVTALNGGALEPTAAPPSLEDLIADRIGRAPMPDLTGIDPRMTIPLDDQPFDGSPAVIRTFALTRDETTRLVQRCRAERATVNSLIVAAASRSCAAIVGTDYIRVFNPIDLRPILDAGESLAPTFGAIRLGFEAHGSTRLWDRARAVRAQTAGAKSEAAVASAAAVSNHFLPPAVTASEVRRYIHQAIDYELLVSNLGAPALDWAGPVRPRAIWGPMVMGRYPGEHMVGVTTFDGSLRVTVAAHKDPAPLLFELEEATRTPQ